MISHKHKCIFIHVPKCAGSSIEKAFGLDVNSNKVNRESVFGWDDINKIYLQHATPQQLIDFKIISKEDWKTYYKFIIIRNTWDKVISDYFWFRETKNFKGSLEDYLYTKNDFLKFMNKNHHSYRGDHLTPQIEYMFLNGKPIMYDKIIYFDKNKLDKKLLELTDDLMLPNDFFKTKVQVGKNFKKHYSKFYTNKFKNQVYRKYKRDIEYFDFVFDEKKNWIDYLKLNFK